MHDEFEALAATASTRPEAESREICSRPSCSAVALTGWVRAGAGIGGGGVRHMQTASLPFPALFGTDQRALSRIRSATSVTSCVF